MEFIKKAQATAESRSDNVRETVQSILHDIEIRREVAVQELAQKYDRWEGEFILGADKKARLIASVPQHVKDDIVFAHEQVRNFAVAQRESLHEFEVENFRRRPCTVTAGCASSRWMWQAAMSLAGDLRMSARPS